MGWRSQPPSGHSVQRLFNPPLSKINPPFYVNPPFLKNVIPPIEKSIYPIPIVVTILIKGALSVIYEASIWYGQMDMRIIISSHYFYIILKSFFKSLNNINNTSNLVLTETFKKILLLTKFSIVQNNSFLNCHQVIRSKFHVIRFLN